MDDLWILSPRTDLVDQIADRSNLLSNPVMDLAGQALAFVGCYEAADFIEGECCVEAKAELVDLTHERVDVTQIAR
jgi:hypothetical protein